MGTLGLLMLLHVVVICAFVAARALHAKLLPLAVPTLEPGVGDAFSLAGAAPVVPSGRQLEEYVQAGLVDLRIMLAQAARRRRNGEAS